MNTPHTPGPWTVDRQYIRSDQFHLAIMTRPDSCMIVEWRANRNLIAAAPDLLEALQMLLPQEPREADSYDRAMWDNARAAIAKATGQTP